MEITTPPLNEVLSSRNHMSFFKGWKRYKGVSFNSGAEPTIDIEPLSLVVDELSKMQGEFPLLLMILCLLTRPTTVSTKSLNFEEML